MTAAGNGWGSLVRGCATVALPLVMLACASAAPQPAVAPLAPPLATRIEAAINRPPFHRAFWSIRIEDEAGRLVCINRLTMAIVEREPAG